MAETEITLGPLTQADSAEVFGWVNNDHPPRSSHPSETVRHFSHDAWFRSIQNKDDVVTFSIRDVADDRLVGCCQLSSINFIHRHAELQISAANACPIGNRIGTQALKKLIRFAFLDMNLHRVYSQVLADDFDALTMNENCGLKSEAVFREAAFVTGEYMDVVSMGILKSEMTPGHG